MAVGVAQVITGVPCVAVPERGTDSGVPTALSVIVMAAERAPIAVGEKVALIVQLPPPASVAPQVVVLPKSPLFAPVIAMLVMSSVETDVFVSVVVIEELVVPTACEPNVRLVGESVTVTDAANPVPLTAIDCGLVESLSVTVRTADRAPLAVGVKVTLIVQLACDATLGVQSSVSEKSPGSAPVKATLDTVSVEAVPFVRVTT